MLRVFSKILFVATAILVCGCSATKPAELSATILTPDGKPASGATAALVPARRHVRIVDGRSIDDDPAYQRCTAADNGRVHFPGMPEPYLFVVIHPTGYARLDGKTFAQTDRVQLQAWASVSGRLMIGDKPGPHKDISAWIADPNIDPEQPFVLAYSDVKTDGEGRFIVDRIPPGKIKVSREYYWTINGQYYSAGTTQRIVVTALPGQKISVSLGGAGRAVVGKVALPPQLSKQGDWQFGGCGAVFRPQPLPLPMPPQVQSDSLAVRQKWYENFVQTHAGKAYLDAQSKLDSTGRMYPAEISPDGTFRLDDVSPGSYSLYFEIRGDIGSASHKYGRVIAQAEPKFIMPDIPGGRSDEPLAIPDVVMEMTGHPPQVGDRAPDFSIKTLDGDDLKLSAFRGKYVFLEFWATWCGPCIGVTPELQAAYARFGKNPRFAMISLSKDDTPYTPKLYVDQHEMPWTQGFIGPESQTEKDFGVEGIPSFWIIDPNGKVIAHPKSSDDLSAAIASVLGK